MKTLQRQASPTVLGAQVSFPFCYVASQFRVFFSWFISVKSLQNVVKASLDQLNFDTLFAEEEEGNDGPCGADHHDTVAYLLLWRILMEIMKRCQIEVN